MKSYKCIPLSKNHIGLLYTILHDTVNCVYSLDQYFFLSLWLTCKGILLVYNSMVHCTRVVCLYFLSNRFTQIIDLFYIYCYVEL